MQCNGCIYFFNNRCYTPDKNYSDDFRNRGEQMREELRILITTENKVIAKYKVDFELKNANDFIDVLDYLR
jgi:hypothetical protein